MTARLTALCRLIPPCDLLADVGCDHGLLSRYALENGVKRVIASDIAEGSLAKARKLLARYGDRAKTVCADGVAAFGDEDPNCIVIAGMGGKTIVDILREYGGNATLILGPQRDVPKLRAFLIERGWAIADDFCVEDKGKFYDVLRAVRGQQTLDAMQVKYGVFYRRFSDVFKKKLERDCARIISYGADATEIKEVLRWQR